MTRERVDCHMAGGRVASLDANAPEASLITSLIPHIIHKTSPQNPPISLLTIQPVPSQPGQPSGKLLGVIKKVARTPTSPSRLSMVSGGNVCDGDAFSTGEVAQVSEFLLAGVTIDGWLH